jgi:hypothetical protein
MSADFSKWLVMSRAGCSLCDELLAELVDLAGDAASDIQVQDIGGDTELERQFGSRIPVLLIEGEFVCAYRLDMTRIRAYLDN